MVFTKRTTNEINLYCELYMDSIKNDIIEWFYKRSGIQGRKISF